MKLTGPLPWRTLGRRIAWALVGLALVVPSLFCAAMIWADSRLTPAVLPSQVVFLDQGWGPAADSPLRQTFYYTPQGVPLGGPEAEVPYAWMVNLERPWSTARFAAAGFMRAYGFVTPAMQTPQNPGDLPVGFAPGWDPRSRQQVVDVTCALCHTGELDSMRSGHLVAVRIDGGPAMHDLGSLSPGHFSGDLMASLVATYFNPFKFHRFAARVLGPANDGAHRARLHDQLWSVLSALGGQAGYEQWHGLHPVPEGPGRTDALGRIANTVFAAELDPGNYHVANAPVSYPPLWDIWKFDWVQYTASVRQPMARNLGESLGTGAQLGLLDQYGRPVPPAECYLVTTVVPNLQVIETTLRSLKPPCWPEGVFGPINVPLAQEGAKLFAAHCQICHGPFPANAIRKTLDAPLKTASQPEWLVHALASDDIGTDPTAAENFVNHTYDLTPTGLSTAAVKAQLALTWGPNYDRQLGFDAATLKACVRGSQDYNTAAANQAHLQAEGRDGYISEQIGPLNLSAVPVAAGLTDLIAFIRPRAFADLRLTPQEQADWDGFGQLDTPFAAEQYKARPLAGVWATAPYLHNGSVPNLYEMISPSYQRSKVFYLGSRDFDPVQVGLVSNGHAAGSFRFDTSLPGDLDSGHDFRAGYIPWHEGAPPAYGNIGPELTPHERMAIIEYLKVHRDDPSDRSCSVYVPVPPPPPPATCSTVAPVSAAPVASAYTGGHR